MSKPLSQSAQAVLNTYRERYAETLRPGPFVDHWQEACMAAALRAVAEECAGLPDGRDCTELMLAIAAELEGAA